MTISQERTSDEVVSTAPSSPSSMAGLHSRGRCNMRGNCGQKSIISPPLPCAVDEEPAKEPDSQEFRKALVDVCGATYASGPVCCEAEQVDYLKANLDQVEPLISSCPACRNNFRALFCALTCDPNQADFLKVLETQDLTKKAGSGWGSVSKATASQWSSNSTGLEAAEGHKRYGEAVKEVNFYVGHTFRTAFFDSCKDVQFGAGNSFAMDLIGGGATDADGFLKFLGDEKPLGSPFQLNFPRAPAGGQHDAPNTPDENGRTPVQKPISPTGSASSKAAGKRVQNSSHSNTTVAINPFNSSPRHCGDPDLLSRCACIDCPEVCAALPPVSLPPSKAESRGQTCHVGPFSCFTFVVSLVYILGVLVFSMGVLAGVKSPKGAFRTIQRRLGLFGASSGDGDGDGTAGGRNKRRRGIRHRNSGISVVSEGSGYERVRLDSEEFDQHGERSGLTSAAGTYGRAPGDRPRPSIGGMGRSQSSSSTRLVGARGLGSGAATEDDSVSSAGDLGGRSGLGPYGDFGGPQAALETTQPRSYALSSTLSRFFYKLGLASASNPSLTFAIALALLALANLGWMHFAVETDPVHLWVAKDSESKLRKEYFDENFGPFYRTQQVFVMDATAKQLAGQRPRTSAFDLDAVTHGRGGDNITSYLNEVAPALTWERLLWWSDVEAAIRDLKSEPNGLTFQDVCFAPSGPGGPCVVQSILGYFGNDPVGAGLDAQTWADQLDNCARQPGDCLPEFGQPLKRNIVLGGIPSVTPKSGDSEGTQRGRPRDARAVVTTWVVSNSLNESAVERAAEWERTLERFLFSIAGIETTADGSPIQEHPLGARRRELGLELALSTEVSLEQEIGSSSNTDVGIVVLSYLLMFLYAALTLGGESRSRAVSPPTPSVYGRTGPPGDSVRTGFAGKLLALIPFLGRNRDRSLSSSRKSVFVQSKFLLGLFGIAIVLMSVSSAVGVFSALGVKVTLVIAEVIPFLVLAVGVDNIFLLCNEMDRQTALAASRNASGSHRHSTVSAAPSTGQHEEDSLLAGDDDEMDSFDGDETEITSYGGLSQPHHKVPAAQRAAKALSRIGPSILLSAVTQITSFLLGAIVPMPAVRNFALYAAGSMFIAAVLQCTVFVAAMALDARRVESGRVDCLPCIQYGPTPSQDFESLSVSGAPSALAAEGVLGRFIRKRYAPFLLKRPVKRAVLVLFGALFALSMIGTHHVQMGLDQRLALPSTSYLRSYFDALETYLDVGPPVYFVARTLDATERAGQQALCGRFTTCQELSLANTLEGERKRPDVSFLAEPASSWIDDFLASLNPVLETCCRVKKRDPTQFCRPSDSPYTCRPCFEDRVPPWNITMDGFPEDAEFLRYLQNWLRTPTDENCPLGGQAAYSTALSFKTGDNDSTVQGLEASNFRTYHTPLRSQSDFIDALAASERISADISERTGADVFAYSVFSVFFDQYSHLPATALQVLGGAAIAIFAITTFLLGSWRTGLIVTCCVASALLGVSAMMGVWGIGLNALTLVNLSVCAAISVEFCAHVARAFVRAPAALPSKHPMAQRERDERAWAALVDVGSSVLSGITGTKLVGISVLAFTRSDLLKLYYAKMWFALIILGALHGLVLLPVLLSLYGGRGWATAEDESEVRRRLLRAQDTTEYRPFAVEGGAEEEEGSEDEL